MLFTCSSIKASMPQCLNAVIMRMISFKVVIKFIRIVAKSCVIINYSVLIWLENSVASSIFSNYSELYYFGPLTTGYSAELKKVRFVYNTH